MWRSTAARLGLAAIVLGAPACDLGLRVPQYVDHRVCAVNAMTRSLTVAGTSQRVIGAFPTAMDGAPEPFEMPGCTRVGGEAQFTMGVVWSGGPIGSVNIGFGGGSFLNVPVPQTGVSTGQLGIPVRVSDKLCQELRDQECGLCHQIDCYEQVVTPAGVVSKTVAQQMLIDCGGGCGLAGADLRMAPMMSEPREDVPHGDCTMPFDPPPTMDPPAEPDLLGAPEDGGIS